MRKFVRMVNFPSRSGKYKDKKDSKNVNEVLRQLQDEGAEIVDIKGSVALSSKPYSTNMVYIIYEADYPIDV